MTSLPALEKMVHSKQLQMSDLNDAQTSAIAQHTLKHLSEEEVFEHFSLSPVELNLLAAIALNLSNLSLFSACIKHGAKFINYSHDPSSERTDSLETDIRLSVVEPHFQYYSRATLRLETILIHFLEQGGPYLNPIPHYLGKENSWCAFELNKGLLEKDFPIVTVENAVLRELSHAPDERKMGLIEKFMSPMQNGFLSVCSSSFWRHCSEQINLIPNHHIEKYLNQKTSDEIKLCPVLSYLHKRRVDFSVKKAPHPHPYSLPTPGRF